MTTKIQSCSVPNEEIFSNTLISNAPGILKSNNPRTTPCQHQRLLDSPAAHSPTIKNLLNVTSADSSMTSDASSPGSPMSDSAPKKLRDLPHTTTLCGCVAFVDVWSSDATDNRSCVFRNFLTRMGATVVRKFTKDQPITHVVFKDGHKSYLQKAQKRNIKIVTCLWVDRCRVLQKWVNEDDYLFDATNYKPPKRFFEMQPQEPEEAVRRSAERLKRRKARFAKKHARIMFQSPLVTNSHSANVTPKGSASKSNQDFMKKYGILVADTPYHPPSPFRYLNPSIVYETPMSDSMQRMMQRMKEGKRVFSPPSSEDSASDGERDDKSPARPVDAALPSNHPMTPEPDREKFSPVADTQCFLKRSWKESGISPPKFDVSYDEVPETQQMEAPDTPQLFEKKKFTFLPGGVHEIPETQHMNISNVSSNAETRLQDVNVREPCTENNPAEENQVGKLLSQTSSQDSAIELNLHVSENSSFHSNDTTVLSKNSSSPIDETFNKNGVAVITSDVPNMQTETAIEINNVQTPTEQNKMHEKPFVTSRKKKRKLLGVDDYVEPLSVLVSPQQSVMSKLNTKRRSTRGRTSQSSMLLPELGFSAYKAVAQSGRFFQKLRSDTPSECSAVSEISTTRVQRCNSESTDFDGSGNSSQETVIQELPQFNEQFSLYDRIKMRQKRNSTCSIDDHSTILLDSCKKRRRKNSENLENEATSMRPQKKIAKTQLEKISKSPLFSSQDARAICASLKKRRSTLDFSSPMLKVSLNGKTKKKQSRKNSIVLTNFHSNERFEVLKTVRSLNGFRLSPVVRDQTTHVVCGAARRTMNVLRAIARGVWLLSKNWVTDSLSAGFWLEEESYEIVTSFPAAQRNRKCRSRNPLWENKLFANFDGHIYISDDTKPSQEDIRELISLCGGCLVGSPRRASVCVGNPGRVIPAMPVVNETWVLDCISENILQPLENYIIPST